MNAIKKLQSVNKTAKKLTDKKAVKKTIKILKGNWIAAKDFLYSTFEESKKPVLNKSTGMVTFYFSVRLLNKVLLLKKQSDILTLRFEFVPNWKNRNNDTMDLIGQTGWKKDKKNGFRVTGNALGTINKLSKYVKDAYTKTDPAYLKFQSAGIASIKESKKVTTAKKAKTTKKAKAKKA